jgi:cell wall-associated NlpC family hydrolase
MSIARKLLFTVSVIVVVFMAFTGFASAQALQTGMVTGDNLNVREGPNTSSNVLAQLSKGVEVTVVEISGDWYKITYDDHSGWVFSGYISLNKVAGEGVINAQDVNIRSYPELSSDVITRLSEGANLNVYGRSGEWYKVELPEGKSGWVFGKYLTIRNSNASRSPDESIPIIEAPKSSNAKAQKIIETAKKYLGVKYVYGGTSPKGFDCSGFVQYVFKECGISLERVAASQAQYGTKVSRGELNTGDLVFFDTNGGHNNIGHVGIYIGNGQFIHASSGRNSRRVVISNLTSGFYNDTYMTARRYLN